MSIIKDLIADLDAIQLAAVKFIAVYTLVESYLVPGFTQGKYRSPSFNSIWDKKWDPK